MFSDTCSVRADRLCIGSPRLVGRRKAGISNMQEFFLHPRCTLCLSSHLEELCLLRARPQTQLENTWEHVTSPKAYRDIRYVCTKGENICHLHKTTDLPRQFPYQRGLWLNPKSVSTWQPTGPGIPKYGPEEFFCMNWICRWIYMDFTPHSSKKGLVVSANENGAIRWGIF